MIYFCNVSVSALRREPNENSEMISQLLYGEKVELLAKNDNYALVKTKYDEIEAWISVLCLSPFDDNNAKLYTNVAHYKLLKDENLLISVGAESEIMKSEIEDFECFIRSFLNVPFLHGGKSFFGLDASAFVQLVYKAKGISLKRFAHQQIEYGSVLDFIFESELGDVAFFENEQGEIYHVGIMISATEIIHCNGKVRIDPIDGFGIFNRLNSTYSHKLRIIKRIL